MFHEIFSILGASWIAKLIRFPMTMLLAVLLGPELFGVWVSFEIAKGYIGLSGLGYMPLLEQRLPRLIIGQEFENLGVASKSSLFAQRCQSGFVGICVLFFFFFFSDDEMYLIGLISALTSLIIEQKNFALQAMSKSFLNFKAYSTYNIVAACIDLLLIPAAYAGGILGLCIVWPFISILKNIAIRITTQNRYQKYFSSRLSIDFLRSNNLEALKFTGVRLSNYCIRRFDTTFLVLFIGKSELGLYAFGLSFATVALDLAHSVASFAGPKLLSIDAGGGSDSQEKVSTISLYLFFLSVGIFSPILIIMIYLASQFIILEFAVAYSGVIDVLPYMLFYAAIMGNVLVAQKVILVKGLINTPTLFNILTVVLGSAIFYTFKGDYSIENFTVWLCLVGFGSLTLNCLIAFSITFRFGSLYLLGVCVLVYACFVVTLVSDFYGSSETLFGSIWLLIIKFGSSLLSVAPLIGLVMWILKRDIGKFKRSNS
jgi:O-antigen/teichoic acid export membrane protein